MWKILSSLTNRISSDYLAAANLMKGKNRRKRIVAYVESYDDILFWRNILCNFEDDKRYFEVMLPNIGKRLERGKKSAITALAANRQLGEYMIACVDADYDYLMQGCSSSSKAVLENPFVFHTYAYSIENLLCYAPGLHNVCVMATLNDHIRFDFVTFLQAYSQIIYPLFVWNIWHYRHERYDKFSLVDLCNIIETGKLKTSTLQESLEHLHSKVQRKIEFFHRHLPNKIMEVAELDKELREKLGVRPEETYLYIQGHHLFDHVIAPLVQHVCYGLVREREDNIRRSAAHATQARNELSCYNNSIQDIPQMLKKSTGYLMSPMVRKIIDDVSERFIKAGEKTQDTETTSTL